MQVNVETLKAMKKQGLNMIIIQAIACAVLILLPNLLAGGVIKFIGVVALILGAVIIFITIKKPSEFVTWKSYILPIAICGLGIFMIFRTDATVQIIAIAIGIAAILKGIGTIFLKESPVQNPRYKIFGIISIAIGISIIVLSNSIDEIFSYYIAAILLYQVIVDLLIYLDLDKFIKAAGDSEVITINRN